MDIYNAGQPFNEYTFNPDETYTTPLTFDNAVGLLKFVALEKDLSINKNALVIELPEGVLIRLQTTELCETFSTFARMKHADFPFEIIAKEDWNKLTRKYRQPIRS